jgi:hypothetical protein
MPMPDSPKLRIALWFALLLAATVLAFGVIGHARAQGTATTEDKPFTVECYYRAKWGYANEFLTLFKKNHYPLLKKEMEMGRILKVSGATPIYHMPEDGRWDYRVTIVYKSASIAHDNFDSAPVLKQMFPDQDTYKKEEQRRFEILEAHWDLPVKDVDLNAR